MSYFSGISSAETVSAEVADVNPCKRVKFASNAVFGENPKFVDQGLLTAHTANKLKSVISPATRVRGLTDNTGGLTSRHGISKVAANRVSEAKAYSDYIRNSEFETMKVFEIRNDSGTRLNEMTRPDQTISRINLVSRIDQNISRINMVSRIDPVSLNNPVSRINPNSRINSPIRPTFNIPLTRQTGNIQLT